MIEAWDLVVVGAGPAGEKAATQAAYFGKKVVVVDKRGEPGGIAVSDAGIPTKTLRETAQYLTGFRHRDVYGVGLALDASLKLERLKARTADVRRTMTTAIQGNLTRMDVAFVQGTATLRADRVVHVATPEGERALRGDVVLLAPGSRPFHPPSIPFDDARVSDSERILDLPKLPQSLCVVGGGAIGCEYASIFAALGVRTTLVEMGDHLLPFADVEVARALADAFTSYGVHVRTGVGLAHVARDGAFLRATLGDGASVECEHLLFAGGRAGNTEGLGLDAASVQVDAKGRIVVDEHFRTTAPGIYAAGDVIGPPALASVSQEQGRVAMCHAFGVKFKDAVDNVPPIGVYSIPELAMAGLTEEQAKKRDDDVEIGVGRFARNTRARIAGATEGMIKLVFKKSDRVLLGVHILGDIASELVHVGQHAIVDGKTIDTFIHRTFNVPTYSEAYKYAAYDGLQRLAAR